MLVREVRCIRKVEDFGFFGRTARDCGGARSLSAAFVPLHRVLSFALQYASS